MMLIIVHAERERELESSLYVQPQSAPLQQQLEPVEKADDRMSPLEIWMGSSPWLTANPPVMSTFKGIPLAPTGVNENWTTGTSVMMYTKL